MTRHTASTTESTVLHVVLGPDTHGVTRHAHTLLAEPALARHRRIHLTDPSGLTCLPTADLTHLHLTDHLVADSAEACADVIQRLAGHRHISLTLHDLPHPDDDPARYQRRARGYARMAAAAETVVVASRHEARLLQNCLPPGERPTPVEVVPLPIPPPTFPHPTPGRPRRHPHTGNNQDLVVLGFLYPGKGHVDVLETIAELPPQIGMIALGAPSPGHTGLVEQLHRHASELGRRLLVTGHVPDRSLLEKLWTAGIPVAPHRQVSASGTLNTWIAAGRRPLAPASPYVTELLERNPDSILDYGPGTDHTDLHEAATAALADPWLTWQDPRRPHPGPRAADCAAVYADVLDRTVVRLTAGAHHAVT
ncbi:Glycosyltransferase involved in cell wall bisynthesis [Austwickia chelonae]|uniref:Glycosyltransferase subfamily 4-like N-terminal domain-containing protein n=1 Tax=Austwickia chelonae NBRC 105200 TaxID=1184607 RepID=K6V6K7_9MICO|nr:glycosyltransferase family 1 protein [Austwickia chelonae]GAB77868.1 hypothetical protein AUCHE_08_01100 [Austwickia chelonae NBRC 105200]SEV91182.1 Glycosyltransferase involved in cell wall bisynthesis [Austwickia chelonae]